jgi:hypothetical protein
MAMQWTSRRVKRVGAFDAKPTLPHASNNVVLSVCISGVAVRLARSVTSGCAVGEHCVAVRVQQIANDHSFNKLEVATWLDFS